MQSEYQSVVSIIGPQVDKRSYIEKVLKEKPQYKECLFCRGYCITDDQTIGKDGYPFFDVWREIVLNDTYRLFIHKDQDYHIMETESLKFLLIGHAFDPFLQQCEEHVLMKRCAENYGKGIQQFLDCINDWTGIFAVFVFEGKSFMGVQDCSGIKALYYGKVDGHICLTSHPQLTADLYALEMDPFIKKLITNRYFNIGNRYLPGNLSPFSELRRIGANVFLKYDGSSFKVNRFFPQEDHPVVTGNDDIKKVIEDLHQILHNSLALIAKKWSRPAISLSGGTDSKTTLACANGHYDSFKYFSFHSKDSEVKDSNAAHTLCDKLGLKHDIYPIPPLEGTEDYQYLKAIIIHSYGYVRGLSDSEISKHIYLYRLKEFDAEVKSWISETTRVFFERKYGIRMPRRLTPRHFSIFQTRFFASPYLLSRCDRIYADFMKEFGLEQPLFNYEHTDLYYWEIRMSSWGMMVTQSLDICHRLTFPLNNRRLLQMFLSLPREDRMKDKIHDAIIEKGNPQILQSEQRVANKYFLPYRIWMEKLYFYYRTALRRGSH